MNKVALRLERTLQNNANRIAYCVGTEVLTYNELWNKANELAASLSVQGSGPVGVYGNKSVEMLISIIACILANRTYVPIDLSIPLIRMKEIVECSKIELLLLCENNVDNPFVIDSGTLTSIIERFIGQQATLSDNEVAYIIFTSGSTGKPKGVPITYNNLDNFIEWISNIPAWKNQGHQNVFNQASFSFDLSVADMYYSLCNGHTLVAENSQEDISLHYKTIAETSITTMVVTPTFMKLLLLNKEFNSVNYPKLQYVYFCGEQLDALLVQRLFNQFPTITVINAYGPTEATSAVCAISITKNMLDNEYLPVGDIKEAAVTIDVINEEIVLKGASVFHGYLNGEQGGHYIENGIHCYRTGDRGIIQKGLLYCMGRIDTQIKYKGYRIELMDIEHNIMKLPYIQDVVVIAKYDENNHIVKMIKAFVVVTKEIGCAQIRADLKELLPGYMIPGSISIVNNLPMNENGKCDRRRLEEL